MNEDSSLRQIEHIHGHMCHSETVNLIMMAIVKRFDFNFTIWKPWVSSFLVSINCGTGTVALMVLVMYFLRSALIKKHQKDHTGYGFTAKLTAAICKGNPNRKTQALEYYIN